MSTRPDPEEILAALRAFFCQPVRLADALPALVVLYGIALLALGLWIGAGIS